MVCLIGLSAVSFAMTSLCKLIFGLGDDFLCQVKQQDRLHGTFETKQNWYN